MVEEIMDNIKYSQRDFSYVYMKVGEAVNDGSDVRAPILQRSK